VEVVTNSLTLSLQYFGIVFYCFTFIEALARRSLSEELFRGENINCVNKFENANKFLAIFIALSRLFVI
jgi:hypothetical protein